MDYGMKRGAGDFEGGDDKRQKMAGASKVLHVRGLPLYTTEQELAAIVAPFGRFERCLILHDKHQAFVQMDSIESAGKVLASLEYQPPSIRTKAIYVQYSSRQEVDASSTQSQPMQGMGMGMQSAEGASCTLIVAVSNVTIPVTLDNIYQICKPYGEVLKIITFNKGMEFQALVQFPNVEQATQAKLFLDGKDLFQGCCHLRVSYSKRQNIVIKQNDHKSRDFTNAGGMQGMGGMQQGMGGMQQGMGGMQQGMGGMQQGMGGMEHGSPVVLVSKLEETKTTPEVLFTLFGVYGDVQRIKILYNKRDTAMIQFTTGQQASYARQNLNGCTLFGQQISVNSSKHANVALPREEEGKELTRDYSGSSEHRFKRKQFMNPKNVCPPSQVLYISNIHENGNEAQLRELFASAQPHSAPPVVEFFKTNRTMAYVAMAGLDEAITGLINVHNYKLHDYPLRVSFSHKEASTISNSDA